MINNLQENEIENLMKSIKENNVVKNGCAKSAFQLTYEIHLQK